MVQLFTFSPKIISEWVSITDPQKKKKNKLGHLRKRCQVNVIHLSNYVQNAHICFYIPDIDKSMILICGSYFFYMLNGQYMYFL